MSVSHIPYSEYMTFLPVPSGARRQLVIWAESAPHASRFFSPESISWSCSPTAVVPRIVWLSADEIEPGWKLRKPILLTIEVDDDGELIATDAFSTIYGNGTSEQAATLDYCTSLVDYYQFLEEKAVGNLQNALRFQALRQHLVKTTNSDATQAERH